MIKNLFFLNLKKNFVCTGISRDKKSFGKVGKRRETARYLV